jgi:hypothetical protein
MQALSVPVVLVHFDEEVPGAQYLLQQWQVRGCVGDHLTATWTWGTQ